MPVRIYADQLPTFSFKTFAFGPSHDDMRAVLAMAPRYTMLQTNGRKREYNPIERRFLDWGFTPMAILDDVPGPAPRWLAKPLPGGPTEVTYENVDFYTSLEPVPDIWHATAAKSHVIHVVYIREAAKDISRDLFLDTWINDTGLIVTAPYES